MKNKQRFYISILTIVILMLLNKFVIFGQTYLIQHVTNAQERIDEYNYLNSPKIIQPKVFIPVNNPTVSSCGTYFIRDNIGNIVNQVFYDSYGNQMIYDGYGKFLYQINK